MELFTGSRVLARKRRKRAGLRVLHWVVFGEDQMDCLAPRSAYFVTMSGLTSVASTDMVHSYSRMLKRSLFSPAQPLARQDEPFPTAAFSHRSNPQRTARVRLGPKTPPPHQLGGAPANVVLLILSHRAPRCGLAWGKARPWARQSVFPDGGREGEIVARVGWARSLTFLSILRAATNLLRQLCPPIEMVIC